MPIIEIPTSDEVKPPVVPQRNTLSQKEIALLSATHYAWCPYNDIELMGPTGLERKVGYDANGDLVTHLKRSELLMFDNIETRELSAKDNFIPNGPPPLLEDVVKYAATCAQELHDASYGEWGFVVLHPLTGLTPEIAFRIFSTIQPRRYDLNVLMQELQVGAVERIAQAKAADEKFPDSWAEETRRIMMIGAQRAVAFAQKTVHTLRTDMANFMGQQVGKSFASPGDEHAFAQLHLPVPSPIAAREQSNDELQTLIKLLAAKALKGDEPTAQESELSRALAAIEQQQAELAELREQMAAIQAAEAERAATPAV